MKYSKPKWSHDFNFIIYFILFIYFFIYFFFFEKLHKFASGTARKILPFISLMPLTYTVIEYQTPIIIIIIIIIEIIITIIIIIINNNKVANTVK